MMNDTDVQQANIDLVRTALDGARARRLDAIEPLFADDFILSHADGLPFGGDYRGWEGYTEALRVTGNFWGGINKLNFREFIPYGHDKVIIHFLLDGKIAKNGQRVEMPVVAIWELKGGKISRIRPFFFDTKKIADLAAI